MNSKLVQFVLSCGYLGHLKRGGAFIATTLTTTLLLYIFTLYPTFAQNSILKGAIAGGMVVWLSLILKGTITKDEATPDFVILPQVIGFLSLLLLLPFSWKYILSGFSLYQFYTTVLPAPLYRLAEFDGFRGVVFPKAGSAIFSFGTLFGLHWVYRTILNYL